jgi:hypothetical protein
LPQLPAVLVHGIEKREDNETVEKKVSASPNAQKPCDSVRVFGEKGSDQTGEQADDNKQSPDGLLVG